MKKWTRALCAAAVLGWVAVAHASVDFLLEIDDVKGELTDSTHPGAIEVLSWSFGASNPATITATGGHTAGKVSLSDLSIRKRLDKASPIFMDACASGKHFNRATLTLRRRTATEVEFAHVVLEDVNVAGILIGLLRDGDTMPETVTLSYQRIGIEYFTIVNDKPADRAAFAWDYFQNIEGGVTFPSTNPDADGDGLPDAWEAAYGVNDPHADDDGDGATNLEEYIAGTSPIDRNQVFKSTLNFTPGTRNATLSWLSVSGKTYRVYVTDTLGGQYQLLTTVSASSEGSTSYPLPPSSLNQFYRVEVAP